MLESHALPSSSHPPQNLFSLLGFTQTIIFLFTVYAFWFRLSCPYLSFHPPLVPYFTFWRIFFSLSLFLVVESRFLVLGSISRFLSLSYMRSTKL